MRMQRSREENLRVMVKECLNLALAGGKLPEGEHEFVIAKSNDIAVMIKVHAPVKTEANR